MRNSSGLESPSYTDFIFIGQMLKKTLLQMYYFLSFSHQVFFNYIVGEVFQPRPRRMRDSSGLESPSYTDFIFIGRRLKKTLLQMYYFLFIFLSSSFFQLYCRRGFPTSTTITHRIYISNTDNCETLQQSLFLQNYLNNILQFLINFHFFLSNVHNTVLTKVYHFYQVFDLFFLQ